MSWDCPVRAADNTLDSVGDGVNLGRRTMTVGERRKVNTGWGERQHMEIEQSEVTEDGKRREVEIRTFCLETYI